jgi:hypothetical protein
MYTTEKSGGIWTWTGYVNTSHNATLACLRSLHTWDRRYDILKYFRQKWRFWQKPKLNYENIDHNIGFLRKMPFFSPKIAENCGYNNDPCIHMYIHGKNCDVHVCAKKAKFNSGQQKKIVDKALFWWNLIRWLGSLPTCQIHISQRIRTR